MTLSQGENHRTYYSTTSERASDMLIFLHGLETENELAFFPGSAYQPLIEAAKNKGVILVLPIGMKGAFPQEKSAYAWGPRNYAENLQFIQDLIQAHRVERVALGGYSNGAYFVADVLQRGDCQRASSFWIQGGGAPIAGAKYRGARVLLEVGEKDQWHLAIVRQLKQSLINAGWVLGKNLEYRETVDGHAIHFTNLPKTLDFLFP